MILKGREQLSVETNILAEKSPEGERQGVSPPSGFPGAGFARKAILVV